MSAVKTPNLEEAKLNGIAPRENLEDLKKEAVFIENETRFFIRLLNQSKSYSSELKKKQINELLSNFDEFLHSDQKEIKTALNGNGSQETLESEKEVSHLRQIWFSVQKKFRELKRSAMTLIEDFFVVKFE